MADPMERPSRARRPAAHTRAATPSSRKDSDAGQRAISTGLPGDRAPSALVHRHRAAWDPAVHTRVTTRDHGPASSDGVPSGTSTGLGAAVGPLWPGGTAATTALQLFRQAGDPRPTCINPEEP